MTSKSTPIVLFPDNPISSSKEDVLDWVPLAETFARQTLKIDATRGLVVGVFGPWGSGKTSFINLARPDFHRADVPVLDFNPWLFSDADQLVGRFFTELSAVMGETSNLEQIGSYLQKYGDILSPAIVTISTLAGSSHAGKALIAVVKSLWKRERSADQRYCLTQQTHRSTCSTQQADRRRARRCRSSPDRRNSRTLQAGAFDSQLSESHLHRCLRQGSCRNGTRRE